MGSGLAAGIRLQTPETRSVPTCSVRSGREGTYKKGERPTRARSFRKAGFARRPPRPALKPHERPCSLTAVSTALVEAPSMPHRACSRPSPPLRPSSMPWCLLFSSAAPHPSLSEVLLRLRLRLLQVPTGVGVRVQVAHTFTSPEFGAGCPGLVSRPR